MRSRPTAARKRLFRGWTASGKQLAAVIVTGCPDGDLLHFPWRLNLGYGCTLRFQAIELEARCDIFGICDTCVCSCIQRILSFLSTRHRATRSLFVLSLIELHSSKPPFSFKSRCQIKKKRTFCGPPLRFCLLLSTVSSATLTKQMAFNLRYANESTKNRAHVLNCNEEIHLDGDSTSKHQSFIRAMQASGSSKA